MHTCVMCTRVCTSHVVQRGIERKEWEGRGGRRTEVCAITEPVRGGREPSCLFFHIREDILLPASHYRLHSLLVQGPEAQSWLVDWFEFNSFV